MLLKHLSSRNEFDRVYFPRFCTKDDTRFSKYAIELIVALSSTNATKMVGEYGPWYQKDWVCIHQPFLGTCLVLFFRFFSLY